MWPAAVFTEQESSDVEENHNWHFYCLCRGHICGPGDGGTILRKLSVWGQELRLPFVDTVPSGSEWDRRFLPAQLLTAKRSMPTNGRAGFAACQPGFDFHAVAAFRCAS